MKTKHGENIVFRMQRIRKKTHVEWEAPILLNGVLKNNKLIVSTPIVAGDIVEINKVKHQIKTVSKMGIGITTRWIGEFL